MRLRNLALMLPLTVVVALSLGVLLAQQKGESSLEKRVTVLEEKVASLEKRIEALERKIGLQTQKQAPLAAKPSAVYIGNARSKKFHKPECEWAQRIAPYNKVTFKSREEAIKEGYEPCKVCKP